MKQSFSLLLIVFVFCSCEKELKIKDLKDTTWKKVAEVSSGTNYWVYPTIQKCELDNLVEFRGDGVLLYKDVGEICPMPGNAVSEWSVRNGRVKMGSTQYTVVSHSKSKLILHWQFKEFHYDRQ